MIDFRNYLLSVEFLTFIEKLTNTKIDHKMISIHSTRYNNTHYLLCHDDQLDNRIFAIMIYLKDMNDNEGGALRLFDSKKNSPTSIVKSITPKFNRFAIFKISKDSFHDVSEVLVDKDRLAIGWWYYVK